jgi:hypothetical protein
MANCKYCGKNAGIRNDAHDECAKKYASGKLALLGRATEAAMGRTPIKTLSEELLLIADSNLVPHDEVKAALAEGLNAAMEILTKNRLPSKEEERRFREYRQHFSLDRRNESAKSSNVPPNLRIVPTGESRLTQNQTLEAISEGRLPGTSQFRRDSLPFNLQKSESMVWVFYDVDYYERKTRRARRGVSHGVSIRVLPGLRYQPRIFSSEGTETNVTEFVDRGTLGVTDKHIYFSGQEKSFRIRYGRIVSFQRQAEGFSLVRDAASARPQIFHTGDGWFSYDLVSKLSRRQG